MKKITLLLTLFFMSASLIFSQANIKKQVADNNTKITFDSTKLLSGTTTEYTEDGQVKKHYFTALGAMLLDNIFISSYNRFVSKAHWAQVTWDDAKEFYKHDMEWDTDWYWTNFVLHPYQGSLYYMGARSANLNAGESFAVTVLGSTIWEYFCETNAPSKNDMVYTTVGAFAVGEMLYRLSIEAEPKSRLARRIINPDSMFTEWVTGEAPRGTTGNIDSFSLRFIAGTTHAHTAFEKVFSNDTEIFPVFAGPEFAVVYNDPYGWDSNTPYSQFELTMGAQFGAGSGEGESKLNEKFMYDIHITSNGMLFSRAVNWGDNKDTTIGLIFDYDFIWHSFIELSSLSPGFAIKQRINHHGGSKSEWQIHIDALMLGTTDYYYYRRDGALEPKGIISAPDYTFRDYNYTYGNETVLKYKYTGKNGWILDTDFHGYAMRVFCNQLQLNMTSGWELIGIATVNAELPVNEKVNIGLGNQVYLKKTIYDEIPEIFQTVYTGSIFARLKLK